MSDIYQRDCFDMKRVGMSVRVFFVYALYVCYKKLGYGEKLCLLLRYFSDVFMSQSIEIYLDDLNLLLLVEVYEHPIQWRMFHSLYNVQMSRKMQKIKSVVDGHKVFDPEGREIIGPRIRSICSCNCAMCMLLHAHLNSMLSDPVQHELNYKFEGIIQLNVKSTADRM